MDRKQFIGYWVGWPYHFCDARAEQELHADGRFEAKIVSDERLKIGCHVAGKWDVVADALQWSYESAKGTRRPRRPQLDPILSLEPNRFVIQEGKGPAQTEYWRSVPSHDTSTNFDLDEVRPFLKTIAGFIEAGFGSKEIADAIKKIQKVEIKKRIQAVYPIIWHDAPAALYLGVLMHDIDAADVCFSGPVELVRRIEEEIDQA
jgi:hypothetical protein